MKRALLFMTERLQVEDKVQVNLIVASSIVIRSGQTKPIKKEMEDSAD